ncbi:MAG: hypothetical protein B7Y70_02665 [Rhizobiales bacterium 35-68-8]|nr:MAG: hypothetical protein B7Z30_07495 [Rhizobiales bacterium 12-68-15]OYY13287.1 MAG: hypothetical protein B7Y70_02665 [Rhizobiales bacterium 35-68-8]
MVNELSARPGLATSPASPASPSPPSKGTTVAVSGTFDINGSQVVVNSGDITKIKEKGISFALSQPVVLGSIDDFIDWLNKELGLPITSAQIDGDINGLPSSPQVLADIKNGLLSFLHANITLTSLAIDTGSKYYAFGVTADFTPPISILGLLKFEGLGLQISHTGTPSSP